MPALSGATIVFDLDGTLVDSAPDLTAALNHVLAEAGRPPISPVTVRHLVGHGARRLIEEGLKSTGRPGEPDEISQLFDAFLVYYADHIADLGGPFPGTRETLATLRERGAKLAVCTNKREALARLLLNRLDMLDSFEAVIGPDTVGVGKPDPRPLIESIHRAGGQIDRALMVGDSASDVGTAQAARVPVIVLRHGYTDIPVDRLGADLVLDSFKGLIDAAERLIGR